MPGAEEAIKSAAGDGWAAVLLVVIILSGLAVMIASFYRLSNAIGTTVTSYVLSTAEASRKLAEATALMAINVDRNLAVSVETLKSVGHILVVIERPDLIRQHDEMIAALHRLEQGRKDGAVDT